jgi:hypothetical protein
LTWNISWAIPTNNAAGNWKAEGHDGAIGIPNKHSDAMTKTLRVLESSSNPESYRSHSDILQRIKLRGPSLPNKAEEVIALIMIHQDEEFSEAFNINPLRQFGELAM